MTESLGNLIARLEERIDNLEEQLARTLRRIEDKVDTTNGRVTNLERQEIRRAAIEEVGKAIHASRMEGLGARFAFVAAAGTVGGLIVAIVALVFNITGV